MDLLQFFSLINYFHRVDQFLIELTGFFYADIG